MKKQAMFVIGLVAFAMAATSQNVTNLSVPSKKIKVVVIETTSDTYVNTTKQHQVFVSSRMTSKGTTWGFANPDTRPGFKIIHSISGDTLKIVTPPRFTPKVVGYCSYSEQIDNVIEIPEDKVVIIRKSEHLHFLDYGSHITVYNAERITGADLQKEKLARLSCKAGHSMWIGNKSDALSLEIINRGNLNLDLTAADIHLDLR